MESAYGIGIANRYAAFIDNEDDASSIDPYALLTNAADADSSKLASGVKTGGPATAAAPGGKPGGAKGPTGGGPGGKPGQQRQQQQQHGSFGDAGALSESKANVAANQKDAGRQQKGSRTGGNPNQRPVRGDQENRTQRSPRVNNASFGSPTFGEGQDGELKPSGGRDFRDGGKDRRNGFEGGRGGGGRRGGPGGAGGPGGPRGGARFGGGKRDFNRHSGSDKTGIKATEKRDGAGAHNWGKPLDDFGAAPEDELAMNGGSAEHAGAEPTGAEGGSGGEAGTGAEGGEGEGKLGEDGEPKVDEPVVKTLDEYKREREEKRLHTQFNTRKANEGEDKSKWKKTYVLKKKEKTDEEEVEYEEIEVEEDPNKRRGRQVLDIEINFRPSDEGRDFTRRGGPGGRGGRGGPRTPRPDGGERRGGGGGEGGERGERGPPGEDRRRGPPRGEGGSGGPGGAEGGGRPPRGGAGGGRPDRGSGRGGGRGGQGGGRFQAAPKFDDLNDFPSL